MAQNAISEAGAVTCRVMRPDDLWFSEALYLQTMLPLLTALGRGDERRLRARFNKGFHRVRSRIVVVQAVDGGWIQVSRSQHAFHLDQLHLTANCRGRGIGTFMIGMLLARAGNAGAPVGLDVLRGNPAIALYRRMGFLTVGEDEEKYQMRWQPESGQ